MIRLYASNAPAWWPYHTASMARWSMPPRPPRPGYYSILIDNGMFTFYREGRRLEPGKWLIMLRKFIHDVRRLRAPREVFVILPDWLGDPAFTVRVASSPEARRLCSEVRCVAVAHSGGGLLGYAKAAEQLASIDNVSMLAAPLKLNCSRPGRGRLIINRSCQLEVARQVCSVARSYGMPCHGLGALLSATHLARLSGSGVTSVDSTSWTRPSAPALRSARRHSAKNSREREEFFRALIELLAGVIELPGNIARLSGAGEAAR